MGLLSWFQSSSPTAAAAEVATGAVKGVLSGIGDAATTIKTLITGKLDPESQVKADFALATIDQSIQLGNMSTNNLEVQSGSMINQWRGALGWVLTISVGAYYIPQAIMGCFLWVWQCSSSMANAQDIAKLVLPRFPVMYGWTDVIQLLIGMLGLAGLRSWDKKNNVASK